MWKFENYYGFYQGTVNPRVRRIKVKHEYYQQNKDNLQVETPEIKDNIKNENTKAQQSLEVRSRWEGSTVNYLINFVQKIIFKV